MDKSMTSKDYHVLYRFPYIRVGGIVNKLKKHFTIVTAAGVPASAFLKLMDVISIDKMTVFIALGMIFISVDVTLSWCEAKTDHVGTGKYVKKKVEGCVDTCIQ
jgi:hypothetical protein